jgi:hypothetical protein
MVTQFSGVNNRLRKTFSNNFTKIIYSTEGYPAEDYHAEDYPAEDYHAEDYAEGYPVENYHTEDYAMVDSTDDLTDYPTTGYPTEDSPTANYSTEVNFLPTSYSTMILSNTSFRDTGYYGCSIAVDDNGGDVSARQYVYVTSLLD